LLLKGFDSGIKKLITARYADFRSSSENSPLDSKVFKKAIGFDYDGTFFVFEKKITNNPLLKLNMESVISHSFREIIRKVEVNSKNGNILIIGLRGSIYKIKFYDKLGEKSRNLASFYEYI
jgi:hypothetical protein